LVLLAHENHHALYSLQLFDIKLDVPYSTTFPALWRLPLLEEAESKKIVSKIINRKFQHKATK